MQMDKEERRVYKDKWNDVTVEELYKVIGLMVLIGVYKSKNEDICQLGVWKIDARFSTRS